MPKTAVLVIDMQKDFTRPEGRFYYPETTGEMIEVREGILLHYM